MAVNYIPNRDGDFNTWLNNFSDLISAAPTSYGLTAGDAAALAAMVGTWNAAYAAALAGPTRGPASVNAKDVARANVQQRARQLAIIIQSNPAVTDSQKTDLQITLRKTNLTPIPAPSTSPLLTFIAATPLQHTLRFADQLTPDSKAKPFGVTALQMSVWISANGVEPVGPPAQLLQLSRNPVAIDFNDGDQGKMATYTARWITAKGLLGPISTVLQSVII